MQDIPKNYFFERKLRPGKYESHFWYVSAAQLRQILFDLIFVEKHEVLIPAEGALPHELVTNFSPRAHHYFVLVLNQEIGNFIKNVKIVCWHSLCCRYHFENVANRVAVAMNLDKFGIVVLEFVVVVFKFLNRVVNVIREHMQV